MVASGKVVEQGKSFKDLFPFEGNSSQLVERSTWQRRINFRTGKKYHRVRKRAVQVVQVIKVRQAVEIYYRRDEKRFEERGGSSNASVIRMVERKKERKGKKERAHPIRSIGLVKEHIPQIVRNIRPLPPSLHPLPFYNATHIPSRCLSTFVFHVFPFLSSFPFALKHHPPKRGWKKRVFFFPSFSLSSTSLDPSTFTGKFLFTAYGWSFRQQVRASVYRISARKLMNLHKSFSETRSIIVTNHGVDIIFDGFRLIRVKWRRAKGIELIEVKFRLIDRKREKKRERSPSF